MTMIQQPRGDCGTEPIDLTEATAQQMYLAHAKDGPHCRPLLAALAFVSSDHDE